MPSDQTRTSTPRRRVALIAGIATSAAVVSLVPGAAHAEPRPSVASVQRQVAALHLEAEQATERYNDVRLSITDARRKLRAVTSRFRRAKAEVGEMQAVMGRLAAASYKSGGVDMTMQLLLSDEPEEFLQQVSALDQLTRRQDVALRGVTAAQQRLAQDQLAVAQQRERLEELGKRLESEARVVRARIAAAESLLNTLKAEERARLEAARRAAVVSARAQRADAPRASRSNRRTGGGGQGAGGGGTYTGPASGRAAVAVRTAYAQLGDPYRWGGTGPNSFDCSGLTSFAWRAAGVSLPHSSSAQYSSGRRVSRSDLQPGDLVFFYSPISHVGIYIGGGRMIDAPYPGTSVRITPISQLPYSGAVRP